MKKSFKPLIIFLLCAAVVALFAYILRGTNFELLNPKGEIAAQEVRLMEIAGVLMLFVAIPVFIMTFTIAWKYRASNTKATYSPDWDHNIVAETIWWLIPCVIIAILAVVT